MLVLGVIATAFVLCVVCVRLFAHFAPAIGLIDKPGGHKVHADPVPPVGGLAIVLATAAGVALLSVYNQAILPIGTFLLSMAILAIVGLVDDLLQLRASIRFVVQACVGLIMVYSANVMLSDLGYLVGPEILYLGAFAIPITLIAVCGVINSINMTDGVDGLAGSLSFVSFSFLALAAAHADRLDYTLLCLTLMAALGGFLVYNLRYLGRLRASVFMGDSGSYILGFALAWICIALAQGKDRAISPVTAIWIFGLPLIDSWAVMIRRLWLHRPLFRADRYHLHHLLVDAGFTVSDAVTTAIALQLLLGTIGLLTQYLGVPEWIMFYTAMTIFAAYLLVASRPWRLVPALGRLHRRLNLINEGARQIYLSAPHTGDSLKPLTEMLQRVVIPYNCRLFAYPTRSGFRHYAVLELPSAAAIRETMKALEHQQGSEPLIIRQYFPRDPAHDARMAMQHVASAERRKHDRRAGLAQLVKLTPDHDKFAVLPVLPRSVSNPTRH